MDIRLGDSKSTLQKSRGQDCEKKGKSKEVGLNFFENLQLFHVTRSSAKLEVEARKGTWEGRCQKKKGLDKSGDSMRGEKVAGNCSVD